MYKNSFKRVISLLFVLAIISGTTPVYAAEARNDKQIRVGYIDYDGFIEKQSDGTYSGYGAEYLAKIA